MGFLDTNDTLNDHSLNNKLDLVDYETWLIKKFNTDEIINIKYKAEEFGITFNKKESKADLYLYNATEEIAVCPEPISFIKEFNDVSDSVVKAHALFVSKISSFEKIKLEKAPMMKGTSSIENRIWMNKTLTGINLRPGILNDDIDKLEPIRMSDDNVHGLIVGRTGSGKSVFINALILSLITEYPPWELNLYLADFKKVELSRYMNNADDLNYNMAYTPHVNACAATSEIRYVISLIKYLTDCMKARQELFSRLGVTKIQEFRNKYKIVLPRVLLIVDEFQQLFSEATNREQEEIQSMLNTITKLGRATGFHLIFASQEMSGTLRGNTLANFKIRMALPCNQQISTDILGNGQAAALERGYVLINTDSGDKTKNKKYRVPFIETDRKDDDYESGKTAFYYYLDEIKAASKLFNLSYKTSSQKFYREELQETESEYCADLDFIRDKKNEAVLDNKSLFDAVVLGKTVLYSPKPNDKVSFYIEKGLNKGIMIACPEQDSAARIRKLLAENLFRSSETTYHFGMENNSLVYERYRIDKATVKYPNQKYYMCDIDKAIGIFELAYYLRFFASKYMSTSQDKIKDFKYAEQELITSLSDKKSIELHESYKSKKNDLDDRLSDVNKKISELNKESRNKLISPIKLYLKRCSDEIILIPADQTKCDLVKLKLYNEVLDSFNVNLDVIGATKKSLDIISNQIDLLSKAEKKTEEEKIQNILAIQRNKIFRRAILFFADKFEGKEPEKTGLSPILDKIYSSIEYEVDNYKKERALKNSIIDDLSVLNDTRKNLEDEIQMFSAYKDDIKISEEEAMTAVNSFFKEVFDSAYSAMGYKKDKPQIPEIIYYLDDNDIKWEFKTGILDEQINLIANDILQVYVDKCRNNTEAEQAFKKMIFWINGMDEIDKIPSRLVEVIRNAINKNILVIAIITSELKDPLVRKAFDYFFVTGNIEKFYSMANINYTKQLLDSIVVNFGIKSKGFDIPFKIYKSELEEVKAPDFIDRLLNF